MKSQLKLALVATLGLGAMSAVAADVEGPWMMRVRAVQLRPENTSDAIRVLGVPSDAIHVSDKTIPEVDFSYFFTPNWAAELILTYPQKHDVKVTASALGALKIGQFKHLPPTLTLQYHFNPTGQFRPYVGAGVNYTIISDDDFGPLNRATGTVTKLDNDSWGGALQAGFDVKVGANSYINFDIKKIYIESDVKNNVLGKVSKVKVNPVAIGIGYGFKF